MSKHFRILSLDGGGIRGLLTAIWLNKLETDLGSPLHQHFDLIAGTSTGSILACAVASGIPTKTIIELFQTHGTRIFPPEQARGSNDPAPRGFLGWLFKGLQFFARQITPTYDGVGLDEVLKETIPDTKFGTLKPMTLVTSYNTQSRNAVIFKSFKEEHKEFLAWEICRASSAAPVFFPAHLLNHGDESLPLIDGGVVANNPSAIAVAEALKLKHEHHKGLEDILLASFGTGSFSSPIGGEIVRSWGLLQWAVGPPAKPLIDVLFDGSVDATNHIVEQLIPEHQMFRFQTTLQESEAGMDNVDPANLAALEAAANDYLNGEGGVLMQELVAALQNSNSEESSS